MHNPIGIIALDLDGTLLNSNKELSARNLAALERAAEAGIHVVASTGRFYGGMPAFIRALPFLRYVLGVNGAEVLDVKTGEVIYKAEIPLSRALEIMAFLDGYPVIYDCYQNDDAFMTEAQKLRIDELVSSPHYKKMMHELRKPVPELKAYLAQKGEDIQKTQFFTDRPELRLWLMEELSRRFEDICVSSSVADNVEINHARANKGEALLALAKHLGIPLAGILAFGDGMNDISMLREAGIGVAMENACPEAKAAADYITASCDADGVALGIEKFCFEKRG